MNQPREPDVFKVDDGQDGMTDKPILERRYDSATTKQIMKNYPALDRACARSDFNHKKETFLMPGAKEEVQKILVS